jgi:hypothetical protein
MPVKKLKSPKPKGTEGHGTEDQTSRTPQEQRDREFFSEDGQETYYKIKDEETRSLWDLAQNLRRIEEVREVYWEAPSNPDSIEEALQLEAEFRGKVRDSARPPLLDDIGRMLAGGDYKALGNLAKSLEYAHLRVKDLSKEKALIVFTIIACDVIWETGRNTSSVTWGAVQKEALRLYSLDIARREDGLSPEQLKKQTVAFMPKGKDASRVINWARIGRRLGINLKHGAAGKPTKEKIAAREREFDKADLKVNYSK